MRAMTSEPLRPQSPQAGEILKTIVRIAHCAGIFSRQCCDVVPRMPAEAFSSLDELVLFLRKIPDLNWRREWDSNFPASLDSVSYRFHNATVAVNGSDAVAHCTPLHAGSALLNRRTHPALAAILRLRMCSSVNC